MTVDKVYVVLWSEKGSQYQLEIQHTYLARGSTVISKAVPLG